MRVLDARSSTVEEILSTLRRDMGSMDRALAAARAIIESVRRRGDEAVLEASERFDEVRPESLRLGRPELEAALGRIPPDLRTALEFAARQIHSFHRAQVPLGYEMPIGPGGSRAGQIPRALDRVGVYVPGGPRGYPSSALMGVIPARVAGVREVLVASPPVKTMGRPPDAVLAAAALAGADEILVAGGAQAIAAMAFGTASVAPVEKIVGPGNVFVTAAKLLVSDRVATDGIAGPSEVLVIADESLETDILAAELVAQAEHDPEAVAIGILVDGRSPEDVLVAVRERTKDPPRGLEMSRALDANGWLLRAASTTQAIDLANALAPEHLVLAVRDARPLRYAVRNAGCVFLGPWSTAAMGDYTAGTNHILPTAGSARWRGALGVRDFLKFVTYVDVKPADVDRLAAPGRTIALAEGFEAHAAALASRLDRARTVAR